VIAPNRYRPLIGLGAGCRASRLTAYQRIMGFGLAFYFSRMFVNVDGIYF
jgi:hypothetical protein